MKCYDCNGTGRDNVKTAQLRLTGTLDKGTYVRCWTCNGNGIDDPNGTYDKGEKK